MAPLSLAQCLCSYPCGYGSWWRHQRETFSALLAFVRRNHRSPVDSPQIGQWTLMFSLICAWTSCWANTRDAGDLRRHRAHFDVTVMVKPSCIKCELCVYISCSVLWAGRTYTYMHGINVFYCFIGFFIKMPVLFSVIHEMYHLVTWGRSLLIHGVWV